MKTTHALNAIAPAILATTLVLIPATQTQAATTLGALNDGTPTLIYDSLTGEAVLENGLGLAHNNYSINSAAGYLLPGATTDPNIVNPPSAITTSTINDLAFSTTGSPYPNFLDLGPALQFLLTSPTLLADLTLTFDTPLIPNLPFDFLHNDPGNTQNNPILPDLFGPAGFSFISAQSSAWFDPPLANAFNYTMDSPGSLFTVIQLPRGLGNTYSIEVADSIVASGLTGGDIYQFSGLGVDSFKVLGLDTFDTAAMSADIFPTYLAFSTATADFTMTAVPEPNALTALATLTLLSLTKRRRRNA